MLRWNQQHSDFEQAWCSPHPSHILTLIHCPLPAALQSFQAGTAAGPRFEFALKTWQTTSGGEVKPTFVVESTHAYIRHSNAKAGDHLLIGTIAGSPHLVRT